MRVPLLTYHPRLASPTTHCQALCVSEAADAGKTPQTFLETACRPLDYDVDDDGVDNAQIRYRLWTRPYRLMRGGRIAVGALMLSW